METKPAWQSKTVIFNVLIGLCGVLGSLGIIPQVQSWIQSNSSLVLGGLSVVGLGLRLATSGKINIWE